MVVTETAALTTILSALFADWPNASVTVTVKFEVPALVGEPVIAPVLLLIPKFAGSAPNEMLHEKGAVPPVTTTEEL